MKQVCLVVMFVALGFGWVGTTQAQDPRLAAFALRCFVPPTPGLHTRAVLVGKITCTHRTVRFVATCFDGLSASRFPDIQVSDGQVQAVEVSVVTSLENGTRQRVARNRCQMQGRNGFLTLRCLASEAHGGEVDVLVSIAPLQPQRFSAGAAP